MIKHIVSILHSALRAGESRRPFATALLMLGLASSGCLSDLDVSVCAREGKCGDSGASGASGASGSAPVTGGGGGKLDAGDAGEAGDFGGASDEAGSTGFGGGGGASATSAGTGGTGTSEGGTGSTGGAPPGGGPNGGAGGPPVPRIVPLWLPAPCGTNAYSASVHAEAGTPPYHWEVSPAIAGWQIDDVPENSGSGLAVLAGAHAGAPAVTVVVTDSAGQQAQATYDVTPRTSCWFAYTAATPEGGSLEVVDPVTRDTPPVALEHNDGVYDFAFSPNGKYLCYRFGADLDHAHGTRLAVVDLASWTEQQLSLSDTPGSSSDVVTAYEWSPDSSTLAVSFVHSGSPYLGGVRFAANGQLSRLTPKQTPVGVGSDLYWVGAGGVGYYADGIIDASSGAPQLVAFDGFASGYYSPLGAAGFSEAKLTAETAYQLPVFMQSTSDGFFINSPSWPALQFNWVQPNGLYPVDHSTRLVSPSGSVTADLSSSSLKLYRARHFGEIATSATDRDCPKLLTWAKNKERFSCVRQVAANEQHAEYGELRVFDLVDDDTLTVAPVQGGYCQGAPSQPAGRPCAWPTYHYSVPDSTQLPRVLSDSGDWLAVSADSAGFNYLYVADLRASPFSLLLAQKLVPSSGNAVATLKLAFSPNEKLLLQLLGGNVAATSVPSGTFSSLPGLDLNVPDGNPVCSDDFAVNPDRWCGSADRAPPFEWDQRSRSVAYRSRDLANDESIVIVDFVPNQNFATQYFPAASCGSKCSGQFAFQP